MAPLMSRKWAESCNMAADEKQVSALIKRHEQIKRWKDSDTNSEPVLPKRSKNTVQFQDGCVFLAACSSGDKAEVEKLLRNVRSADINTANVDGLTALHQACIDDNVEMVEFLVEHGAYIDICDNEGWTPLHATSSCGFLDIARYLINHNANVAAVNNDGDLPFDIADSVDMENLLQQEMDRKGIDAEAARCSEEQRMLEDANLWLSGKKVKEVRHPKTGASALHVAAAKGYMKVMKLLLEAGVDINAEDNDGWTPLHAAAHWGQKEACQILVNNMCDMGHKNKAGHTAVDLAENGMMELLEELKEKQPSLRKDDGKTTDIILPTSGYREKRSSSVTRMSADQKQNVLHHASEMENITTLPSLHPKKTEDNRTGTTETDHRNDTIKPPLPRSQLPVTTAVSTAATTALSQSNGDNENTISSRLRRPASVTSPIRDTDQPLPSAKSVTEFRRPASVTSPIKDTDQPLPLAKSVTELRRPASVTSPIKDTDQPLPSAKSVTELRRPASVTSPIKDTDQPLPSAKSVTELRRPASVTSTGTPIKDTDQPLPSAKSSIELRRPASVTSPIKDTDQPLPSAKSSIELRRPASVTSTGTDSEMSQASPVTKSSIELRRPASVTIPIKDTDQPLPSAKSVTELQRPASESGTCTGTEMNQPLPVTKSRTELRRPASATSTGTAIDPPASITSSGTAIDQVLPMAKSNIELQRSASVTSPIRDTDQPLPVAKSSIELRRPASVTSISKDTEIPQPLPAAKSSRESQWPASVTSAVTDTEKSRALLMSKLSPSVELQRPASISSTSTDTDSLPAAKSSVELRRPASVSSTSTDTETSRSLSSAKPNPIVELRRPASIATSTPRVELRHSLNRDPLTTGLKLRRPHLSKIDGLSEEDFTPPITSTTTTATAPTTTDTSTKAADKTAVLSTRQLSIPKGENISDLNGTSVQDSAAKNPNNSPRLGRNLVSRFISVPLHLPTEKLQERLAQSRLSSTDPIGTSTSTTRSTPSTTTSTTTTASTTRTTDGDTKLADRNTIPFGQTYGGYRSSFSGRTNYVPYYLQRQQREAQAAAGGLSHTSDDTSAPSVPGLSHDRGGSISRANSVTSGGYSSTPASVTTTTTTTTGSTNSVFKRSYEPPKRDEETETQRKARAKHARQTRRSTQGVSLEDIEKAEESIHRDKNSSSLPTTTSQSLSLRSSAITREATSVGNGVVASTASTTTASTAGIPTASTTTTVSSIARASDPGGHSDDKSVSSGYKRWTSDDKSDSTDSYNIRGSYRRSRIERDSSSSTSAADVTTTYVPRSQRLAALTSTDTVTTTTAQPIPSLLLTSASTQDESSTQDKKEEKKESTSLRARRQRRERRSTGIGLDGEGGETGGQSKTEDDDPDDNIGSALQDGLSSNNDHLSQRSKSAIEVTKSVGQIEIDYKKKFDEEKIENERLKKELNVAKRGLEEAKSELDRASRQRDTARNNERDKKILEKKLADMEEELKKVESLKADNQRLKDENGALIRVIGKLSK